MRAFESDAKVGLIATVNPEGLPHITLISSIRAKTPTQLIWGQFTEGRSKKHVQENPKTGFLILTMDKALWRGRARWTHTATQGEDFEMYNQLPMFRYNAYFGIHTVHYMDLVETYGREKLPLARIILATIVTRLTKSGARAAEDSPILKPWARALFDKPGALKFLALIDDQGFPAIIPIVQCQSSDSRRLVFSPLAYGRELRGLDQGQPVAVFGMTMDMEDILVRGIFTGPGRQKGLGVGRVDLDWVYNSMPPKQGQIYPETPLEPVIHF